MEYRILGRTKLRVSVISLGGGPFLSKEITDIPIIKNLINITKNVSEILGSSFLTNRLNISTFGDIIKLGYESGINLVETSWEYNEPRISKAISKIEGGKNKIFIAAKSKARDSKTIQNAVNQSLLNLKKEFIDVYQLHFVENTRDFDCRLKGGVLKQLKKEQKENRVNFIGVTGHHIPTLIKAVKTNEFDTVQVPYSMTHTLAEELFDVCKEYDAGVMIMKPLDGGLLVTSHASSKILKNDTKCLTAENALKFILSNKKVHTAIVGMKKPIEVRENTKICNQDLMMSRKEKLFLMKKTKKLFDMFNNKYCRVCRYCMPCAVHGEQFRIDTYLRLYALHRLYGYSRFKKEYSKLRLKADACTGCGECEKKCPYNLPIREMLKRAHEELNMESSFFKNKNHFRVI